MSLTVVLLQVRELKHGRLAMLAVAGYAAQEAITRVPLIPGAKAALSSAAAALGIFFH